MRPLRAARSNSLVAASLAAGVACGSFAFLSAVRRAERCARLRTVAARDLRMFFLADAIFGTKRYLQNGQDRLKLRESRVAEPNRPTWRKSRQDKALKRFDTRGHGHYVSHRSLTAARISSPNASRVPSHQIRTADVALSGSAVLRAGAVVLRDRA